MPVENPNPVELSKKVDEHAHKTLIAAGVSATVTIFVNPVAGLVMTSEVWRQAWNINRARKQIEKMLSEPQG